MADALLDRLDASQTVMVPAFPVNGRTVYQGHLFVGDRLLNDSGMQYHPLSPMQDADLVRVLSRQTTHPVGLLSHSVLSQGASAACGHLSALAEQGTRHVICDTLDEQNLDILAEATVLMPLVTGGSGLGRLYPPSTVPKAGLSPLRNRGVYSLHQAACWCCPGSRLDIPGTSSRFSGLPS